MGAILLWWWWYSMRIDQECGVSVQVRGGKGGGEENLSPVAAADDRRMTTKRFLFLLPRELLDHLAEQ